MRLPKHQIQANGDERLSRLRGFNRMVLLIKLVILPHPFHSVV